MKHLSEQERTLIWQALRETRWFATWLSSYMFCDIDKLSEVCRGDILEAAECYLKEKK